MSPVGCTCGLRRPRCPACVAMIMRSWAGIARNRGDDWARAVAAQVGTDRDWPPYEGRCAEIARRKVAYLDRDDPGVIEALAIECHRFAAYRWEELRRGR